MFEHKPTLSLFFSHSVWDLLAAHNSYTTDQTLITVSSGGKPQPSYASRGTPAFSVLSPGYRPALQHALSHATSHRFLSGHCYLTHGKCPKYLSAHLLSLHWGVRFSFWHKNKGGGRDRMTVIDITIRTDDITRLFHHAVLGTLKKTPYRSAWHAIMSPVLVVCLCLPFGGGSYWTWTEC